MCDCQDHCTYVTMEPPPAQCGVLTRTHAQVTQKTGIPIHRQKLQDEIAQVADRQYKALARKFHADKGGDPARFDEIKSAKSVLVDTQHTQEHPNRGPNLLYQYVLKNDHKVWLQEQNASASAVQHAKVKVSGKYIARGKSRLWPPGWSRLMIESGEPPQCKIPKFSTPASVRSNRNSEVALQIEWGPRHRLAIHFELDMQKEGEQWRGVYRGDSDSAIHQAPFPGEYTFRVRATNEQGVGPWSCEAPAQLDDLGRLVKGNHYQRYMQDLQNQRHAAHMSSKAEALRALQLAVERCEEQLRGTLHAAVRQTIIVELMRALLQAGKGFVDNEYLIRKANSLLVLLQTKELTREWRAELKRWTETLVNVEDALSNDQVDLEVRTRMQSLEPDRLNWLYQHVLTRTNKIIASYTKSSDVTKMPIADRETHRRMACLLQLTLINNNVFGRRDDFCQKLADLRKAIGRGIMLEEKAKAEEDAQRQLATLQFVQTKQAEQERLALARQQRAALLLEQQRRDAEQLDSRVKASAEKERQLNLERTQVKHAKEAQQKRSKELAANRKKEQTNAKKAKADAARVKKEAAQAKQNKAEAAAQKQREDALL